MIGGGYIGLEMGTVYAELGTKVTVVELTDGLLPGADRDLVSPLANRLEKLFDKILSEHESRGADRQERFDRRETAKCRRHE